MSGKPRRWERVERLDASTTLEALRVATGVTLSLVGPCPGGQVGAAYVRWPDGHRSVLKWRPGATVAQLRAGPLAVAEALRLVGYPAPATELVAQIEHAAVMVQELLPGTPPERLDHHGLEQVIALNHAQADVLADLSDVPAANLHLIDDGPGYCLHEPLRCHNRRTAALERRIVALATDGPNVLPGRDAMHMDFHHGNMLTSGGAITGVVDWDGAARGDRRLDLVTLRFGLHAADADPSVTRRLDAVLDSFPEDVLWPAWAHMSLRQVDWAIRHFTPAEVDHWLELAEQRIS